MSGPGESRGFDVLAMIGEAEAFDIEASGALSDDEIDDLCAQGRE